MIEQETFTVCNCMGPALNAETGMCHRCNGEVDIYPHDFIREQMDEINSLTEQNKILTEKLERITKRLDVEKTRFNRLKIGE